MYMYIHYILDLLLIIVTAHAHVYVQLLDSLLLVHIMQLNLLMWAL